MTASFKCHQHTGLVTSSKLASLQLLVLPVAWSCKSYEYASCKLISRKKIDSFNLIEWRIRFFFLARVKTHNRRCFSNIDARRLSFSLMSVRSAIDCAWIAIDQIMKLWSIQNEYQTSINPWKSTFMVFKVLYDAERLSYCQIFIILLWNGSLYPFSLGQSPRSALGLGFGDQRVT